MFNNQLREEQRSFPDCITYYEETFHALSRIFFEFIQDSFGQVANTSTSYQSVKYNAERGIYVRRPRSLYDITTTTLLRQIPKKQK